MLVFIIQSHVIKVLQIHGKDGTMKGIFFYGKKKMRGCAGEQELLETRIVSVLKLISCTMLSQVFQKHC